MKYISPIPAKKPDALASGLFRKAPSGRRGKDFRPIRPTVYWRADTSSTTICIGIWVARRVGL